MYTSVEATILCARAGLEQFSVTCILSLTMYFIYAYVFKYAASHLETCMEQATNKPK